MILILFLSVSASLISVYHNKFSEIKKFVSSRKQYKQKKKQQNNYWPKWHSLV